MRMERSNKAIIIWVFLTLLMSRAKKKTGLFPKLKKLKKLDHLFLCGVVEALLVLMPDRKCIYR